MILVADSHLTDDGPSAEEFLAMLVRIEQTTEDFVLLGDILDFWVGLPRFESRIGEHVLHWCSREIDRRQIGLLEGNHEFYVGACHRECFSFWSRRHWRDGELLLAHGDLVNRRDRGYRLLRLATKNPLSRFVFGTLPGGRRLARFIKHKLGEAGKVREKFLPEAAVKEFAEEWFAKGVRRIFLGHFHREYRYEGTNGGVCELIPAWQGTGKVMRYDPDTDESELIHWQDL
jgi:UDP-2,3-diacylglucosamine hydrolase